MIIYIKLYWFSTHAIRICGFNCSFLNCFFFVSSPVDRLSMVPMIPLELVYGMVFVKQHKLNINYIVAIMERHSR